MAASGSGSGRVTLKDDDAGGWEWMRCGACLRPRKHLLYTHVSVRMDAMLKDPCAGCPDDIIPNQFTGTSVRVVIATRPLSVQLWASLCCAAAPVPMTSHPDFSPAQQPPSSLLVPHC